MTRNKDVKNKSVDSSKLQYKLRTYREANGWSIRDIAKRIGVSPSTYFKIESTEGRLPSLDSVLAIARLYEITVEDLVKGAYK